MTGGPAPEIEFRVLGPFEVLAGGVSLPLGSPKQRALLAALVISANRVMSVDRLMEELWGDEAPARAMASLQAYVSRLRRLLQPAGGKRNRSDVLATQAPGYVLRVAPESIDAVRFEIEVGRGIRVLGAGDAAAAVDVFESALARWRGAPYGDFSFEEFAQGEITRLSELRLAAVEGRLAALVATGQPAAAIAEAEAVLRDHPLREGVWASLMTALYRAGRQGDALRAYQRARRVIGEELGLEPGPALRELEARILHQAPGLESDRPGAEVVPAVSEPAGRSAAPHPGQDAEDPLVGRRDELRRIRGAVGSALEGRGQAVLLHGEPGIGKTRLARAAALQAAQVGAVVGRGGCVEGQGTAAYWPWTHAVREVLEALGSTELPLAAREALATLAPLDTALARWAGGVPTPPQPADPHLARTRLQRAAIDAVVALARCQPVCLVIEDLQWADEPSLQLLSLLAPELAGGPVLLVVTYRDQELGQAVADALSSLERHADTIDLALGGLDQVSVHRFVELTAGQSVSASVAASIAARTSGNPLFVVELTRLLRSERTLHEDAVRHAPVPAGVREVIGRRLVRLPAQTSTVLTVAAVIGRAFPIGLLERVTQLPEEELLDRIESAVAIGLVVEGGGSVGTFSFTHDLVRDTLQETVGGTRRARLHARVAEAILEHGDEHDPTRPFEVAHHLLAALPMVPAEEVGRHLLAAADAAVRRLAFEQAEEELRRALDLVELLPPEARAGFELAVRVRLARVLSVARGHASPEEREHSERAVELADEVQPSADVILALWGAAVSAGMAGEYSRTLAIGDRLLKWGEEQGDRTVLYLGHALVGGCSWYLGGPERAARHLGLAVELLDEGSLDPGLFYDRTHGVWSRSAHAVVAWLAGRDEEADALMADALRRAQGPGMAFGLVFALLFDTLLAVLRRDRAHARRRAEDVVERADALGYRQFAAFGRTLAAYAHEDPRVRVRELEALAESGSTGVRLFEPLFLALRAEAELDVGRLDNAACLLRRALDSAVATGERFYEPEIHRLLGEVARHADRREEASSHFERGRSVAGELGVHALDRRLASHQAGSLPSSPPGR